MKKLRIAILDDHQIVIDGLLLLLQNHEVIEVVYTQTSPVQAVQDIPNLQLDILLTDMIMPQLKGNEVIKALRQQLPTLKYIVLSMNSDGYYVYQQIETNGVEGYLIKTTNKQELLDAIITVGDGGTFYSNEILAEYTRYKKEVVNNQNLNLTTREVEVIQQIAKDFTNKQIAQNLFISERTVETHRKNILRKTNTHSVVALLEFAKANSLV
jgi:two-component system, NarL family, nitrate/nitrite response regulator NarL